MQNEIQTMFSEENFESLAQELTILLDTKISLWKFWKIPTLLRRIINVLMLLWYCLCEIKERQMAIIDVCKRLGLSIESQQQQINILIERTNK